MIKEAIAQLVGGHSLTMDEASTVMNEIMEGTATPAQFGAFVTALRLKGETVEEIAGLARTMRAKALRVTIMSRSLIHVAPVVTARAPLISLPLPLSWRRLRAESCQARQPRYEQSVRQRRCTGGAGSKD